MTKLINKYISHHSNTYHSAIKVKPIGVKSSAYIVSSKGIDNKSPKFKISDIIKISKQKNIFAKCFVRNWSENTVSWTYIIRDLKGQEIVGKFYEKEFRKK